MEGLWSAHSQQKVFKIWGNMVQICWSREEQRTDVNGCLSTKECYVTTLTTMEGRGRVEELS